MKSKKETFASLMDSFSYRYDLRPVFDDLLTMSMCAVTQIPGQSKSHYEDLYLETVAKYKEEKLRILFPELFARLVFEMEERLEDSQGNDVLGEYYEQNFCRKNSGQFFTPWPVCKLMSQCVVGDKPKDSERPLRILDPTCGSGRMLRAAALDIGPGHEFYGIDIDHTCVKMTALNLFLNGIFHSEVMCSDALSHDDFRMSYVISLLPFGIFRIDQKEKSKLWQMYKNTFPDKKEICKPEITLPSENGETAGSGTQLQLF